MGSNFIEKKDATLNIITLQGQIPAGYIVPPGGKIIFEDANVSGHWINDQEITNLEYVPKTIGDFATDIILEKHSFDHEPSMTIKNIADDDITLFGGEIDVNQPIEPGQKFMFHYATQIDGNYVDGKIFANNSRDIQTIEEVLQAAESEVEEFSGNVNNMTDVNDDSEEEAVVEESMVNDTTVNVRTYLDGDINGKDAILVTGEKIVIKSASVTLNGQQILKDGEKEVEFYNDGYGPQKLSINQDGDINLVPVDISRDLINEPDNNHEPGGEDLGFSGDDPTNDDNIDLHNDDM
ncbi:MAG: hypothetical protein HRU35_06595 [Rickettsiaceae bacterium]|nr:hypothetical protein [Rickettsiaceae bacterium]